MSDLLIRQAARNNALWCDAACRAHGRPGEFREGLWINRRETPPFYPNVVTLVGAEGAVAQLEQIASLRASGPAGEWAVKDSFAALDLAPLGFRVLFEAEWIFRPAAALPPGVVTGRWARVTDAPTLAAWEAAWAGGPDEQDRAPIFLPSLLAEEGVAVFAAYREGQIAAGMIANRTGEVVGLSNIFVPATDADGLRAGCVAQAMGTFPGLPLVGYEAGADLAGMRTLGFESLGPLRVWATVG